MHQHPQQAEAMGMQLDRMYRALADGDFERAIALHDDIAAQPPLEKNLIEEIELGVQDLGRRMWLSSRSLEQSYAH